MTIDQMLDDARAQIDRMYVFQLTEAFHRGAIFVDIRPQAQRAIEGTLPGALAIERNVEWVIVCSEGYTSSLAAASLQQLGLHKATDLVGGYQAIKAAGLLGALSGVRHCSRELAAVSAH